MNRLCFLHGTLNGKIQINPRIFVRNNIKACILMPDFSENTGCNCSYDLSGNKSCCNSVDTDPVNLFPYKDSHQGCRQNYHRILQKCGKACNGCLLNGLVIADNKLIPQIRCHTQSKDSQRLDHMTAQLATAASEHDSDFLGKQHNKDKDHSQQDVTVFQHLFTENPDSHVVLLSKKDSCHIGDHTDDSACKHLDNQQHIVTDSKYCHTFLTQLIHDNGIQSKCLYKISCHKDQHWHTCDDCFLCNPQLARL